jgi:hypothetical protein
MNSRDKKLAARLKEQDLKLAKEYPIAAAIKALSNDIKPCEDRVKQCLDLQKEIILLGSNIIQERNDFDRWLEANKIIATEVTEPKYHSIINKAVQFRKKRMEQEKNGLSSYPDFTPFSNRLNKIADDLLEKDEKKNRLDSHDAKLHALDWENFNILKKNIDELIIKGQETFNTCEKTIRELKIVCKQKIDELNIIINVLNSKVRAEGEEYKPQGEEQPGAAPPAPISALPKANMQPSAPPLLNGSASQNHSLFAPQNRPSTNAAPSAPPRNTSEPSAPLPEAGRPPSHASTTDGENSDNSRERTPTPPRSPNQSPASVAKTGQFARNPKVDKLVAEQKDLVADTGSTCCCVIS